MNDLERGRQAYAQRAWKDACESLVRADQIEPLAPEDLELLGIAAFMLAREDDFMGAFDRAHHAYIANGRELRAVRCAFWIGTNLVLRGEHAQGGGWLGRAQRLLDRQDTDAVERGYLLVPGIFRHEAAGISTLRRRSPPRPPTSPSASATPTCWRSPSTPAAGC